MTLRPLHAGIVVALVAIALYLPALRNGFAYDDVAVIQRDVRVHDLASIPSFFTQGYWEDADLALYRPLVTTSFAIDWNVSGGSAGWFMFVNALWNAAVCVLVFVFLLRFTAILPAFAASLLFAAHPVHVEAVANAVGRAEVMAAAFMLAALLLWPRAHSADRGRVPAVAALFALALLTKESAIMLPALLVLGDAARGDLTPVTVRPWIRERAVPLMLLAAIAVAYLLLRAAILGGVAPARLDAALEVTAGADRFATALQAWPVYLRLLFFPVVLLADYGPRIIMPADGVTASAIAGAVILLALVAGGVAAWWKGRGAVALTLLWLPVALLPVSNLIIPIGIIVAERTLYLPSVALALGAALVTHRLPSAQSTRPRVRRAMIAAAFAIAVVLLATRTLIRIPEWRSTDAIFAALLRDRPDSFRAHWHHARLSAVAGDYDRSLQQYVTALELWPYRHRLVLETVRASLRVGNLNYANGLARFAHERWPADPNAAHLLAATTLDLGDTIAARQIINDALQRLPGDSLLLRMQRAVSDGTVR